MTPEQAKALREPFPAEVVGKLPRVWCGACRDAKQLKHCDKHRAVRCDVCRQSRITEAHKHLDFVGHAEATDRLLQVDPEWTWEPMGFTAEGLPAMDGNGLWIRLTIAGVSRPGYGHAGDKRGGDAVKEAIGDAIRNAAMRFGVALDLWGASFKDDDGKEEQQRTAEPLATTDAVPVERLAELLASATTEKAVDSYRDEGRRGYHLGAYTPEQVEQIKGWVESARTRVRQDSAGEENQAWPETAQVPA